MTTRIQEDTFLYLAVALDTLELLLYHLSQLSTLGAVLCPYAQKKEYWIKYITLTQVLWG